jgi:tetratricopeptide (TPR) repeat protein
MPHVFIVAILLVLAPAACAGPGREARSPLAPKVLQKSSDGVLTPHGAASFLEGEIAMQQGDGAAAASAYSLALAMDPGNPFLQTSLASARALEGDVQKARGILEKVIEKNPDYEFALNTYGKLCLDLGEEEKAETLFKEAMKAAPESQEGYLNLIDLYLAAGKTKAAHAAAEELIENVPDLPEGYAFSAETAFSLGMIEASQKRLRQYIGLIPLDEKQDRYGVLLKQGKAMLEAGRAEYALFLLGNYRDIFPGDAAAAEATVKALVALERIEEARQVARQLKEENFMLMAELLYETGAYGEALDVLEKIVPPQEAEGRPPMAGVIGAVGECYRMQVGKARSILGQFGPDEIAWRAEALEKILLLLLSSGLEEDACDILAQDPAAAQVLESFDVMNAMALALAGKRLAGKRKDFSEKLAGSDAGKILLAWSGVLEGREEGAAWLEANIDSIIGHAPGGWLLEEARIVKAVLVGEGLISAKQTELLDLVVKIGEDDPSCRMIPVLKGRFFFLVGNNERAESWLEKARGEKPADVLAGLWLAELLAEEDEAEKAREEAKAALHLHPPLYFVKRLLALL